MGRRLHSKGPTPNEPHALILLPSKSGTPISRGQERRTDNLQVPRRPPWLPPTISTFVRYHRINDPSSPAMPSQPGHASNAGIVTDASSGERHIPESVRADGSTRKAIKVRPGYRPPEDVEVYKNRTAEAFRERGKRIGIPGAAGIQGEKPDQAASAAANKNAKRREARKKAKAGEGDDAASTDKQETKQPEPEPVDPQVESEKKARNLKKKLKQAKELQNKKEGGEALLPEQIAKVIKINELIRELEALGFDADGEPKDKSGEKAGKENEKTE